MRASGRAWGLLALALVPLLPSLGVGFLLDDWIGLALLETQGVLETLRGSFSGQGPFFRPLGLALFAAEWKLFGLRAELWHAVHLLVFTATCVLTGILAGRLAPLERRRPAAIATAALALLYPGRVEVYAWIAAVFDLLALLLVITALVLAVEAQRRADGHRLAWIGLLAFLGPWAKESAFCLPLLTAALAAFDDSARGEPSRRSRWRPTGAAAVGAILALVLRMAFLGSVAPEAVLTLPRPGTAWLPLRAVFFPLVPLDNPWVLALATTAAAALGLRLVWAFRAGAGSVSRRLALLGLTVMAVGALPALPFLTPNTLEAHSRYLALPGLGIALLAGTLRIHRGRLAKLATALLLATWAGGTLARMDAWLEAAHRRDRILSAVEEVTRSPGPHLVWIEGPINQHRNVHLLGGALDAALDVSLPGRSLRADSAFYRRYRGLPAVPPKPRPGEQVHRFRYEPKPPRLVVLE